MSKWKVLLNFSFNSFQLIFTIDIYTHTVINSLISFLLIIIAFALHLKLRPSIKLVINTCSVELNLLIIHIKRNIDASYNLYS